MAIAKERWQKKYLIMGRESQTIELSTDLGIYHIPCCSIVLMFYNGRVYGKCHHRT